MITASTVPARIPIRIAPLTLRTIRMAMIVSPNTKTNVGQPRRLPS